MSDDQNQDPAVESANSPTDASDPAGQPGWTFNADDANITGDDTAGPAVADFTPVAWSGDEFIAHPKDTTWIAKLVIGSLILAGAVYLISDLMGEPDWVPALVVVIVASVFGFLAMRPPRRLDYAIDESGIHIGNRSYPFELFKSFAIIPEGEHQAIWLMPLKRFTPIITIYFDDQDEERIAQALGANLALEDLQPGLIEQLMHRLKF